MLLSIWRTLHQGDVGALDLPDWEADKSGQPHTREEDEATVRVLQPRHQHRHHWWLSPSTLQTTTYHFSNHLPKTSTKLTSSKISLNWGGCFWEHSSYLSINSHKQDFKLRKFFHQFFNQKVYTNHFLQNIGSPVHGKVKGQVNAASVHIKQPHKTLRYTRQLSFDEVFHNIHVLEINSYIASSVFLTKYQVCFVDSKQSKLILQHPQQLKPS